MLKNIRILHNKLFIFLMLCCGGLTARPLNILFIVGHFPAPSQTFILNQMKGLIDLGHKVFIFSFHKNSNEYMHPDIEKYKLLDRVTYTYFPKVLPECDIVFCQFGYHGKKIFDMPQLTQWLLTKKVVTCLRGSDITTRLIKKPRKYRKLFEKGALFLPVCDYFRKLLIKCGCKDNKIVVQYAGIDSKAFAFKRRSLPTQGPVKLISVCRLVEKKGINYTIQAIAKTVRQYSNIIYTIVGDGPERQYLEGLIRTLHLQDKVILSGWKSQEDVIKMLDQSHIFILPSVTASDGNEEGIPNALKEAMSMGLPVIATWHAGNSELIEDRVSGFLIPQRNAFAIYSKIIYLIENPQIWPAITTAARKIVEEKFDTKKITRTLNALFYQLCQ